MIVDAEAAGLDPIRLGRIDDHVLDRYIRPEKIAGGQIAIVRNGVVGYMRNFGVQSRESATPVTDDTIWRLFSMTKPITGAAMMTLYERGHFQLDDPVDRWIPEWKDMTVKETDTSGESRIVGAVRPPTIRDLLTHTSGLGYGPNNDDLELDRPAWHAGHDLQSMAVAIAEWPLRFQPGSSWLYSHGMDVAARLVEIMSGMPFDEYLRISIFEPLGMTDTDFWVPPNKIGRLATTYQRNRSKHLVVADDPTTSAYRFKPKLLLGGAGLVSTMGDYLRFCEMLLGLQVGGERLLARKSLELMMANHLPGDGDLSDFVVPNSYGEVGFAGHGFGLTVAVSKSPIASGVVGSAGSCTWGGAASTTFWVDPNEALAVVFMTQLIPSGTFNFGGQLRALVYSAVR